MRQTLIVANWKMNGSFEMAHSIVGDILEGVRQFESPAMVICPPFVHLQRVAQLISTAPLVSLGAQNCSEHSAGAHTGEVSSSMLKDVGCEYVICGHSERRRLHGETDSAIARKAVAAIGAGLTPIVCVGETMEERRSDRTRATIERQINAILEQCGRELIDWVTIAYEPVWAIGTGVSASPDQVEEVHRLIRDRLAQLSRKAAERCRVLYGGSVTDENAAPVLEQRDVDGCLVGGASLKAAQFVEICRMAQR